MKSTYYDEPEEFFIPMDDDEFGFPEIIEESRLNEMAEIGSFNAKKNQFIVFIWSRDPGYIPHFHIGDAGTYPKCTEFQTCIKLQSPEYFPHGNKYTDRLNSKQIEKLIAFLQEKTDLGITNWQYVLLTWNKNSSNQKVDINQVMPDYTKLNEKK